MYYKDPWRWTKSPVGWPYTNLSSSSSASPITSSIVSLISSSFRSIISVYCHHNNPAVTKAMSSPLSQIPSWSSVVVVNSSLSWYCALPLEIDDIYVNISNTHTYTYTHTHIKHTYTRTHTCTNTHACTHTHTYIHIYIHTHTYTYIHTYIHTPTHTHAHTKHTCTLNSTVFTLTFDTPFKAWAMAACDRRVYSEHLVSGRGYKWVGLTCIFSETACKLAFMR